MLGLVNGGKLFAGSFGIDKLNTYIQSYKSGSTSYFDHRRNSYNPAFLVFVLGYSWRLNKRAVEWLGRFESWRAKPQTDTLRNTEFYTWTLASNKTKAKGNRTQRRENGRGSLRTEQDEQEEMKLRPTATLFEIVLFLHFFLVLQRAAARVIPNTGNNGKQSRVPVLPGLHDLNLDRSQEDKYFHEPTGHEEGADDRLGHYDSRFFRGMVTDAERVDTLTHMVRSYLQFADAHGLETWIAHGTLLGWWWNGKVENSSFNKFLRSFFFFFFFSF